MKKYLEAPELIREMCYGLLDRVVVGGLPKITGKEREIDIVYKVDIASVLRYRLKKQRRSVCFNAIHTLFSLIFVVSIKLGVNVYV